MKAAHSLESGPVREAARGRWVVLLQALAPELELALARPGRHVPCPVHGGRDGFRLFKDVEASGGGICNTCGAKPDGFSLLRWLKGWSFPQALEAVDAALGGTRSAEFSADRLPLPAVAKPARTAQEDAQIRKRIETVWAETLDWQDASAKPMRDYLARRGLDTQVLDGVDALRFHPGLRHHDEEGRCGGTFPAMVATVSDPEGRPVTLHRTYLDESGRKAPVENPRRMMPVPADRQVLGAAIRLGPSGPVVELAEGIETALAVRQATGLPVWSAVNAALLAAFDPPPGTAKVRIWCDLDRNGVGGEAALRLARRLEPNGIEVECMPPPDSLPWESKGVDWLDVLNALGPAGFPKLAD